MKIPVYLYIIAVSITFGFINYNKIKQKSYLYYTIYFLMLTLVIELVAAWMSSKNRNTLILYNFFTLFEFLFYLWTLRQIIKKRMVKKLIGYAMVILLIFSLLNIFYIQGIRRFQSYSYSIGSLLIVAFCIYYFYEIFLIPHSINLLRQPPFWICSALLFYYTISFPIFGLTNVVPTLPNVIINNLSTFITILNVLLYSMFSIAFICRFKIRKSLQSLSLVAS